MQKRWNAFFDPALMVFLRLEVRPVRRGRGTKVKRMIRAIRVLFIPNSKQVLQLSVKNRQKFKKPEKRKRRLQRSISRRYENNKKGDC